MHETIEPLQVGVTAVTSLGFGGALLAFGNMFGRRGRNARSRRVLPASQSITYNDADSVERRRIVTVIDNDAKRRFEIHLDGQLAGIAEYVRTADTVTFHHTEIDPRFRGEGLAGKLISFALEASRNAGLSVQPVCPFVRAFIEKHADDNVARASELTNIEEMRECCELPS